ncbi:MAG: thioesterase family protein [Rhodobacteraceae bacterium]|nr:thioesterase family protein [Paracoccaceae bacterium]
MFPFVRLAKDMIIAVRQPPIGLTDTHISQHRCWPWDLDMMMELNNGRTLTLYDLGRFMAAQRVGLFKALFRNKWSMTMAGCTTRYRRRIRGFEKFEMRTRVLCWDDKFLYLEQSMWKRDGQCASHLVMRAAVTDKNGIVAPIQAITAMGYGDATPLPMPDWINAWSTAEAGRPWPPMQDSLA